MRSWWLVFVVVGWVAALQAAEPLRPFLAGADLAAPLEGAVVQVRKALETQGLRIVGDGAPLKGARVLLATHPDQLAAAAATSLGGFAALTRVSLVESGGKIQVAAFNPDWLAASCRLSRPLTRVHQALTKALGGGAAFGCKDGISDKQLRTYHYMLGMPYFDDVVELAEYPDQAQALQAVEAGLKAGAGGCRKLARVDLPTCSGWVDASVRRRS